MSSEVSAYGPAARALHSSLMTFAIRPLGSADRVRARRLLVGANDAPYEIAPVVDEKLFGDGFAETPVQRVAIANGEICGVVVTCGRFIRLLAVDRDRRRHGVGRALLAAAEAHIAERHESVVIAAEAGNYFTPGVDERDAATVNFLEASGYSRSETTMNLYASLESLPPLAGTARRATHEESEHVLEWISNHFGRVWAFEARHAFDAELPTLFIAEHGGAIAGFSAHEANNRGLGSFGPAGVMSSRRHLGLGRDLLLASLHDLRRLGYSRAIIAWAAAEEFYRKSCGAVPGAHFVVFKKELRSAK